MNRRRATIGWGVTISFLGIAFFHAIPPVQTWAQAELIEPSLPEPPPGYEWGLVFLEDFEGTELDMTKWAFPPAAPRRDGWWLPEAVSLDGQGHLVIRTYWDGERYVDGCIRTRDKFEPTYGFFIARIQFQRQPGHWSAFWLYNDSVGSTANAGRDGTEIDIIEKPWLDDRAQHALHWDGYGAEHQSAGKLIEVPGIMEGFHTFALWWTPTEYIFYVDGQETWRTSAGGVCQVPLYIKLSDEIGDWAGDIRQAELPDQFLVDYVRVFQLFPATDPVTSRFRESLFFPQFADGFWGGRANRTRIVLHNPREEPLSGELRFRRPSGEPATVSVAGETASTFPFELPARGTRELVTDAAGTLQTGAVEALIESVTSGPVFVDPDDPPGSSQAAGARLEGGLVYDILGESVSVPASPPRLRQRVYVSNSAEERTGIALYNPSRLYPAVVQLVLLSAAGERVAARELRLEPGAQRARFLDEPDLFGAAGLDWTDFRGTLEVQATGAAAVSLVGLIQRTDGALMAVPAAASEYEVPGRRCGAQATASATWSGSEEFAAAKAVDANFYSRWRSGAGGGTLTVDFGEPVWIEGLDVYFDLAEYAPSYAVALSDDGAEWEGVFATSSGYGGFPEPVRFGATKARFVRLEVTGSGGSPVSIWELLPVPDSPCNTSSWVEQRVDELVGRMNLDEKTTFVYGETPMNLRPIARLGIPRLLLADGPLGLRWEQATAFPAAIALAASWNVDLAERFGRAIGREWKNKGRHMWLGPGMNIIRIPQNGRNFEYYSEDPYLASRMAVAAVRGAQSEGIIATPKHYVANNQEYQRYSIDIRVSERALREIYLPAFRAAVVEGGAWAVMAAYNQVNGAHCTENKWLLQDVLKDEWGFRGLVVSDWGASHSTVGTANNGLDLEMDGNNPVGAYWGQGQLKAAVENGQVAEATVDDKVRRILRAMFSTKVLSEPHPAPNLQMTEHWSLARAIAQEGMVLLKNEGNLLPLDPQASQTLALIGPNLAEARTGGGGSSQVTPYRAVSPLEGIRDAVGPNVTLLEVPGSYLGGGSIPAAPEEWLRVPQAENPGVIGDYFTNMNLQGNPAGRRYDRTIDFDWGSGGPFGGFPADHFSVRWSGRLRVPESGNYLIGTVSDDGVRVYLDGELIIENWTDHAATLDQTERYLEGGRDYQLIVEYYENGGDAVIRFGCLKNDLLEDAVAAAAEADTALLFVGLSADLEGEGWDRPSMDLPEQQVELIQQVSAVNPRTVVVIIAGSQVGMENWIGGVPAVLQAWYPGQEGGHAIADILFGRVNPSGKLPMTFVRRWEDHPAFGLYPGGIYSDDIYVGYRYFDTFGVEPLFPFGHGLSYTTFAYDDLEIDASQLVETGFVTVRCRITNTGGRFGQEVVQVYVRDPESTVGRPEKELKAFAKVPLFPGQSRTVQFELGPEAFAYWHPGLRAWHVEPGRFEILVGASSRDIRLEGLFEWPDEVGAERTWLIFPQFANGEVEGRPNRTRIILTNGAGRGFSGSLRFLDPSGAPASVPVGGENVAELPVELPPWSSFDLSTDGTGPLQTGVVRVEGPRATSTADLPSLRGVVFFDILGHRVSVPAVAPSREHRLYVSQTAGERTGVAAYNPLRDRDLELTLRLLNEAGEEMAVKSIPLAPGERRVGFLDEEGWFAVFFTALSGDFRGTLRIQVEGEGIVSALGLIQRRADGSLVAFVLGE
ncbi:MAG: hypothetical protein Kow00109_07370 [Acidobacteriota bacterium]